jgi:hypothetical protein
MNFFKIKSTLTHSTSFAFLEVLKLEINFNRIIFSISNYYILLQKKKKGLFLIGISDLFKGNFRFAYGRTFFYTYFSDRKLFAHTITSYTVPKNTTYFSSDVNFFFCVIIFLKILVLGSKSHFSQETKKTNNNTKKYFIYIFLLIKYLAELSSVILISFKDLKLSYLSLAKVQSFSADENFSNHFL